MLKMTLLTSLVSLSGFYVSQVEAAPTPATIKIDGSSTVFPITEAVAEEFQTAKKGNVRVTVGISGTGGGFKKFCRGKSMCRMPQDLFPRMKWGFVRVLE
jgi:phosphate transport system substrate-binding protein